jgi:two-component system, NarL family, nitrate/nitrite response regulator NarL
MNRSIRLVVVDDHAIFRRGLIGLISDFEGFEVVGQAASGEDALQLIAKHKPDLVLLDINMPGMSGVDTLRALRSSGFSQPVLMLTVSQNENDLMGAIMAGASGYLLKNAEPESLRQTMQNVAGGQSVLAPEVTAQVFRVIRNRMGPTNELTLSEREVEILRCMAKGLTIQEAAKQLFISENTVKTHMRHILTKLEVSNRAEAVAKALQTGLI